MTCDYRNALGGVENTFPWTVPRAGHILSNRQSRILVESETVPNVLGFTADFSVFGLPVLLSKEKKRKRLMLSAVPSIRLWDPPETSSVRWLKTTQVVISFVCDQPTMDSVDLTLQSTAAPLHHFTIAGRAILFSLLSTRHMLTIANLIPSRAPGTVQPHRSHAGELDPSR